MSLFSRARVMTASDEDARDVLQDAFVRLWSSTKPVEGEDHARNLLYRTVSNLSIDHVRKGSAVERVPLEHLGDSSETSADDDANELMERVTAIINDELSARDREILLRRDRDGWEMDEIASAYGLSEANVRMIVSRARKTVRNIYRQQR